MSKLSLLKKYIRYKTRSFTDHDLHSPFVFNLYTELIRNKHRHYDFDTLDKVRHDLLNNRQVIEVTDFGAGSRVFKGSRRQVKEIAKHGISQRKYAEFIYRFANKFKPAKIVELGTSLGLGTLYLAKACPQSEVYTIEGSANLADFAKQLFEQQGQKNIEVLTGNFDDELPRLLHKLDSVDLLYVDGNHAYGPTLNYFEQALQKKHSGSIFIFDDIHWSEGMERAWNEIRQHPEVTLSLDLFYIGVVFFRKEQKQKEHFVLKY